MAGFHQFLMIFSCNSLILGQHIQKLKHRSKMTQIVEFRVGIMYTCSRKGPIFHYKPKTDVH